MRIIIAIVIAGILVASAILLAFHWQISVGTGFVSYRLNQWTGHVEVCDLSSVGEPAECQPVPFGR